MNDSSKQKKVTAWKKDSTEAVHDELSLWIERSDSERKILYREGATICRFDFATKELIQADEIKELWIVRLFCESFELVARRRSVQPCCWQLRLVANQDQLVEGQVLAIAQSCSLCLHGKAVDKESISVAPDRFHKSTVHYPTDGEMQAGDEFRLNVVFMKPDDGVEIDVWNSLSRVSLSKAAQ